MVADRFLNFMDMIDGGGMGAAGDEFKGGGLLSDIANALFQPAGYRERRRAMAETRPQARPMQMGGAQTPVAPQPPAGPAGAGAGMAGPGMPGGPMQTMPMPTAPAMPTDPRAMSPQPTYVFGPNNSQGMVNGQMPQEIPTPPPMGMESMMSQLDAVLTPDQRRQLEMLPPDQRMGVIQRMMQMQGM